MWGVYCMVNRVRGVLGCRVCCVYCRVKSAKSIVGCVECVVYIVG